MTQQNIGPRSTKNISQMLTDEKSCSTPPPTRRASIGCAPVLFFCCGRLSYHASVFLSASSLLNVLYHSLHALALSCCDLIIQLRARCQNFCQDQSTKIIQPESLPTFHCKPSEVTIRELARWPCSFVVG